MINDTLFSVMNRPLVFRILACVVCLDLFEVKGQTNDWRSYVQEMAEEEPDETILENMIEELIQLENHPMNLNAVTRDALERFPLLSAGEAAGLADFLTKNRPVYTVYELRNVPSLSFNKIQLILPFFFVGEFEPQEASLRMRDVLRYGKKELQIRLDKTLTERAGYRTYPDSVLARYPNRKYAGEDFYHSLRFAFSYREKVQFGVIVEKDAGEPLFRPLKGFDHDGFYFILREEKGFLKNVTLGDYRLSFGQGLIVNNDFMISKSWAVTNIVRRTQAPKRHFSAAESGFFRGGAAVFNLNPVSVTLFYSRKPIDANLSDEEITSFKTDGYHRTPLEISKKGNTREQVAGANVNYRKDRLQIGASAVYYSYNRKDNPALRDYNRYYLRGYHHWNASVDYSYRFSHLVVAGETAVAGNGAVATLNAIHYNPSSRLSVSLLHRYFPISYNALYGQAFSEGGKVQNEQGIYLGATCSLSSRISLTSYIDYVYFPWMKYGVDTPSHAIDGYFLGTYSFSDASKLDLRYKFKRKEKNAHYPDDESTTVLPYYTHKLRLRFAHVPEKGWYFRSAAEAVRYRQQYVSEEFGYQLSQQIGYRGKGKMTGEMYGSYFDTDSYQTRLYSNERNLLNTFYIPSFYGQGARLALSLRCAVTSKFSVSVKGAFTHYFDRDFIGTGTEKIDGSDRTDVYMYIRWKF